jgi:hypothetical protein
MGLFWGLSFELKTSSERKIGQDLSRGFYRSQEPGLLDVIAMDLFSHLHIRVALNSPNAVTLFQEEASGSFIGGLGENSKKWNLIRARR